MLGPALSVSEAELDEMVDRLAAPCWRRCCPADVAQAPSRRMLSGVSVVGVAVDVELGQLGEQLTVDRQVALTPHGLELLERLLELAPAGAHQLVELAVELLELGVDLLELLVVLDPLHAELAHQRQDLVAGLLDHEVVVRLTDHAEEGEQRERRAHHDALPHRLVDQRRIALVDEAR